MLTLKTVAPMKSHSSASCTSAERDLDQRELHLYDQPRAGHTDLHGTSGQEAEGTERWKRELKEGPRGRGELGGSWSSRATECSSGDPSLHVSA